MVDVSRRGTVIRTAVAVGKVAPSKFESWLARPFKFVDRTRFTGWPFCSILDQEDH